MKVVNISIEGVKPAVPALVKGQRGEYFAFLHGERGRGRWEYMIPLAAREFPMPQIPKYEAGEDGSSYCTLCRDRMPADWAGRDCAFCKNAPGRVYAGREFALVDLRREDGRGNPLYLAVSGRNDGTDLVLWNLKPGFRGGATYEVFGDARVIAKGYEAQGAAGNMGGADCPVVLATGDCVLRWRRGGRLYGSPEEWVARRENGVWTVRPADVDAIESAVFAQ